MQTARVSSLCQPTHMAWTMATMYSEHLHPSLLFRAACLLRLSLLHQLWLPIALVGCLVLAVIVFCIRKARSAVSRVQEEEGGVDDVEVCGWRWFACFVYGNSFSFSYWLFSGMVWAYAGLCCAVMGRVHEEERRGDGLDAVNTTSSTCFHCFEAWFRHTLLTSSAAVSMSPGKQCGCVSFFCYRLYVA